MEIYFSYFALRRSSVFIQLFPSILSLFFHPIPFTLPASALIRFLASTSLSTGKISPLHVGVENARREDIVEKLRELLTLSLSPTRVLRLDFPTGNTQRHSSARLEQQTTMLTAISNYCNLEQRVGGISI